MKKIILTALFLLVMASFLLESSSRTRLQEKIPAQTKLDVKNSILADEPANLQPFSFDSPPKERQAVRPYSQLHSAKSTP